MVNSRIIPTESQQQIALIEWASMMPILKDYLFHIPNEGKRSLSFGKKLKAQGMRAGVSDLFLPYPVRHYHGCWIELKARPQSKITEAQMTWLIKMLALDYCCAICYGFDEAKEFLMAYLKGDMPIILKYRDPIK